VDPRPDTFIREQVSSEFARPHSRIRPGGLFNSPHMTSSSNRAGRLGAWREVGGSVLVRTWAPERKSLEVVLFDADLKAADSVPMREEGGGFFSVEIPAPAFPFFYKLRVDGQGPFTDPWSRHQPHGAHGPSSVDLDGFGWTDSTWKGVPLEDLVLYEVHVGTATPEGTFVGLIPQLPQLKSLGITTLELLPLASFPGRWNWGYDGVGWFAPAVQYGGPDGLRRLVNAAHSHGLGVIVDAVYNHFGPDGNYLRCFSERYFTHAHQTPWGDGVNYQDPSGVVRDLALSSVEMWIRDYHLDGLRLDAVHAIGDDSLLAEIARRAKTAGAGRHVLVTAEDDRNARTLVEPFDSGGLGMDAVWADDFHHQLRRAYAGDHESYFEDYTGSAKDIAATLNAGWFYQGQQSKHAKGPRGTRTDGLSPTRFIHCIQNHDQVGNRPTGNRLGSDVSPSAYRAMSALLLLSPFTPLLFAGQEWNSKTPFMFFTDFHADLGRLVTEGRRKEFAAFSRFSHQEVPDPQAESTFRGSILSPAERATPEARAMWTYCQDLLSLRHQHPAFRERTLGSYRAWAEGKDAVILERTGDGRRVRIVVSLGGAVDAGALCPGAKVLLDSESARYGGSRETPGSVLKGPGALVFEE
jgi:maltooligosyltrehalose trehalohydrolase